MRLTRFAIRLKKWKLKLPLNHERHHHHPNQLKPSLNNLLLTLLTATILTTTLYNFSNKSLEIKFQLFLFVTMWGRTVFKKVAGNVQRAYVILAWKGCRFIRRFLLQRSGRKMERCVECRRGGPWSCVESDQSLLESSWRHSVSQTPHVVALCLAGRTVWWAGLSENHWEPQSTCWSEHSCRHVERQVQFLEKRNN